MKVSVFLHTIKSQVGFMDATHNAFEDLKLFTRFVICYHICVFLMITPPAEYQQLTHERLEVKFTNFGRVDHLWPHKAGDCVYL